MRIFRFFALIAALAFVVATACDPKPPTPTPPEVYIDAGPAVNDWPSEADAKVPVCVTACRRLLALGCEEALTPDGGLSCYGVCEKAELSGRWSLNPECVSKAAGRESLRACKTVTCGRK